MSQLITQIQGRRVLREGIHNTVTNLSRFNVEPARIGISHRVDTVFQEAGLARLSNLYAGAEAPLMSGIAALRPKVSLTLRYANYLARTHPLKASLAAASCKAVLADIVAQKVIEKKESLDYRRTGLFFSFGVFYSGIICHTLYTTIYPLVFSSRIPQITAAASALADNLINTPFIFFPTFYILREMFLEQKGSLTTAFEKYKLEIRESMIASWKIWLPAHLITFGVMPSHLRVPFASIVAFFYYTVVSVQQSAFEARRLKTELGLESG